MTEMKHPSLYSDLSRNYLNGSIPGSLAELSKPSGVCKGPLEDNLLERVSSSRPWKFEKAWRDYIFNLSLFMYDTSI
ncbi:hypothetical protein NC653_003996 [Populus alba x Populus x berolinensis]|uniref:Uncharacterized protein n=1 Tax=Populus alba x Populus x berolinensis TaxID=444605 RepID=A0AAD6RT30_9ROSI|nr:hypothetical protein NC653_003996 [Populus alba x Populus x berolinensis]